MKNVRKMDGSVEDFDRAKIEQSILRAGGDVNLAAKVAKTVPEEVALTTANIRQKVANELTKRNQDVARRYWGTRRMTAKRAVDAAEGSAMLTEDVMSKLGSKPGEPLQICYGDKIHSVMALEGAENPRSIRMHEKDMAKIGATEGNRIAVRRSP